MCRCQLTPEQKCFHFLLKWSIANVSSQIRWQCVPHTYTRSSETLVFILGVCYIIVVWIEIVSVAVPQLTTASRMCSIWSAVGTTATWKTTTTELCWTSAIQLWPIWSSNICTSRQCSTPGLGTKVFLLICMCLSWNYSSFECVVTQNLSRHKQNWIIVHSISYS